MLRSSLLGHVFFLHKAVGQRIKVTSVLCSQMSGLKSVEFAQETIKKATEKLRKKSMNDQDGGGGDGGATYEAVIDVSKEFESEIKDVNAVYDEREKVRSHLIGKVISDKCSKSVTVEVFYENFVQKYQMFKRGRSKIMAHDEDEIGDIGDIVRIVPCRPMSKKKRYKVYEILRKRLI